jgi:hypothetical protein
MYFNSTIRFVTMGGVFYMKLSDTQYLPLSSFRDKLHLPTQRLPAYRY